MPRSTKPKLNPGEGSPENETMRPVARRARASSKGTPASKAAGAIEKPPAGKRKAIAQPPVVNGAAAFLDDRYQRIQAEAYFIAESRGFQGGSPDDDWLEAERRIDARIAEGKPAT